ncbi:integrase catalytic domain-containing protein [Trichonephila clavipes]|nr:integrase catalytic domain-containing protein [Trichonephila clavipes]
MSGANSLSEALELQNQLTQMLSSAGLVLKKWTSNCNELLNSIDSDMRLPNASLNIDNDDTVKTLDITLEWEQLAKDVQLVNDIKIPRFLFVDSDNQLHLFGSSDASEKTYAAAIYCRSVSDTEKINVQLIIAKTRVVPLKPVSLPRLELCGALLLVKLMDFTCKTLNYPISQTQFYTDSTIVLAWVGSHASRWKTFVAIRVAKIQTLSSATKWHHISGSANPADLATRGVSSSTLLTSIWLCGPKFLHETFPIQTDSSVPSLNDDVPEERYWALQSTIVPNHLPDVNDLLHKFSSLSKLKRVITYCLRFINNCRNSNDKIIGLLKTSELTNAMYILIKSVQIVEFKNEINALKGNQSLSCRSKILSLNPFLDCSNILRVGGRLRHSNLAYGHKHPILLPKRHILTDLIVRHYHEILLHAGTQLVQSCIQEQYWIIGARDVIRHLIRKCIKCCKVRASTHH